LAAFKEVADSFTPKDWKKECMANLGEPAMPAEGIEKPLGL
jgi:acid phosphatase